MKWGQDELENLEELDRDPESRANPRRRALQLRLKKRRESAMLRQVLEEGGYKDLAKMVKISSKEVEDYD